MRRAKVLLVGMALVAGVLVPATPTAAARACERPEPEFTYDDELFTAKLTVDYRGCAWWKGRFIIIEGYVEQGGPLGGEGLSGMKMCGGFEIITSGPKGSKPPKKHRPKRPMRCSIKVGVSSRSVDILQPYEGEFYYRWKDGEETIPFRFLCSSVPSRNCME